MLILFIIHFKECGPFFPGGGRAAGCAERGVAVAPAEGVPARDEGVAGGEARPARHQPPHRLLARAGQGECRPTEGQCHNRPAAKKEAHEIDFA